MAEQYGVVHVGQLEALGLSRGAASKRVRAHRLVRIHRGVYAGSLSLTNEGRWSAALLAAGPGAVLSGAAAVELWRMHRIVDDRIEVLTPGHARKIPGVLVSSTRSLPAVERASHRGMRVASPSRAIVEYSIRADAYDTIGVLHEAAFRQRLDPEEVLAINSRLRARAGSSKLVFAMAAHEAGSAGVYSTEERYLLSLYARAGLELPFPNVALDTPRGPYLVDQRWPGRACVVELDGSGHRRRSARARDIDRNAAIAAAGIELLRIPVDRMYGDPDGVVDDVRRMLDRHPRRL